MINGNIYCLQFVISIAGAVEYAFVDEAGYPYLETTLNQPSSNNILEAIEMTVHLSRFNGLLLYYIDNNYNQLITTLQDSKPPTMKVEFRGEQYTIAVNILCHCKIYSCLYENLIFSFQVTNTVNIKCNNGSVNRHSFLEKRDVKQDYPIPDFDKHIYAYLWFINVPQVTSRFGKVYPNPDYLTGCIKSVTYNGATVNLNPVGMNRTCETKCQPKRCNDGKCLETYDHEVKCICNDTFLNGEFCDKSLSLLGQWNFTFHFKIIKLSWKFPNKNPTKVFSLNNKASSIEVIINNSTELLFQFIHSNLTFGSIITKNYSACNNNIMTITFDDKNIIVKFKHNNIWETSNIFINFMLYKVEFDKVTFGEKNVQNAGDCVYKLADDEIEWLPMKPKKLFRGANMNKLLDGPEMNNRKESNNCNPSNESSKVLENSSWYFNTDLKIIIVIGCIDAILLIIFAWLFADYKGCRSILYLNHTRNPKC